MTDSERALGSKWFEEVWNKGRRDAIPEMLAAGAVIHDGGTDSVGPQGFYAFYDRIRSAFSEIRVTVADIFAEDDKVVVRWSCSCKHTGEGLGFPATARTVSFTGISIIRIHEGKIAEGWQNWDMLGMIQQLQGTSTNATYIGAR